MFSELTPAATLAVKDMSKARSFYEETLGLTPTEGVGGTFYQCGGGGLFVYESAYAGTNKATAASFNAPAESFDDEVATLRGKGVSFMTFDMDGLEWNDGVASMGDVKSVWFTDPDGNILNLSTGEM